MYWGRWVIHSRLPQSGYSCSVANAPLGCRKQGLAGRSVTCSRSIGPSRMLASAALFPEVLPYEVPPYLV